MTVALLWSQAWYWGKCLVNGVIQLVRSNPKEQCRITQLPVGELKRGQWDVVEAVPVIELGFSFHAFFIFILVVSFSVCILFFLFGLLLIQYLEGHCLPAHVYIWPCLYTNLTTFDLRQSLNSELLQSL